MQFVDQHQTQLSVTLNHIESNAFEIEYELDALRNVIDDDDIDNEEAWAAVEATMAQLNAIAKKLKVLVHG